jgi:lysophospholipase L1-like esterase
LNYQKIACWGDSQTFGARTYGCYPLYLAQLLNRDTQYVWQTLNFSTNGHTVRDLWLRLADELLTVRDVYVACVLIGVNDVGNAAPIDLFEEYYRQSLDALRIAGFRAIFCGEIPPVWPDGNAFFAAETQARRDEYNERITKVVDGTPDTYQVAFPDLSSNCYTDPVHFNEAGNLEVARSFADAIRQH